MKVLDDLKKAFYHLAFSLQQRSVHCEFVQYTKKNKDGFTGSSQSSERSAHASENH